MNVNIEAVHRDLEVQVRKGRHPWEAAGELRWLAGVQVSQGLLSNQSHEEMIQVIYEWLAAEMDIPLAESHVARAVVEMYARFLTGKVNIASVNPPPWEALELAWREWREGTGGR